MYVPLMLILENKVEIRVSSIVLFCFFFKYECSEKYNFLRLTFKCVRAKLSQGHWSEIKTNMMYEQAVKNRGHETQPVKHLLWLP